MSGGDGTPAGSARERILARVREAVDGRDPSEHPGPFGGWRPEEEGGDTLVALFARHFVVAGGSVERFTDAEAARAWLQYRADEAGGVSLGVGVPPSLRPTAPDVPPDRASLGISAARGAVAETGSLIMDARDGRAAQLLPPVHLVIVDAATIHATLAEAFAELVADLPSAVGLHSGPSKSADLGKVMVTGVHGPGEVVAVVVG